MRGDVVIQKWIFNSPEKVVEIGNRFKVVVSSSESNYLDFVNSGLFAMSRREADPCFHFNSERECQKRVLGGGACAWAEKIDTGFLETMVFPRLFGVAERLWNNLNSTMIETQEQYESFRNMRCTVLSRGIRASIPRSYEAIYTPPNPNSCWSTSFA